ncbi:hypothetical protein HMI55_004762 [Coelomomyces lativittatus]|nr:hypothetical protein HMI55_004762 [Coelomomyces lativittatus]
MAVLHAARDILLSQPALIELHPPVKIVDPPSSYPPHPLDPSPPLDPTPTSSLDHPLHPPAPLSSPKFLQHPYPSKVNEDVEEEVDEDGEGEGEGEEDGSRVIYEDSSTLALYSIKGELEEDEEKMGEKGGGRVEEANDAETEVELAGEKEVEHEAIEKNPSLSFN